MAQSGTPRSFPGRGGMLATSLLSAGLVGWDQPADEAQAEPVPAREPVKQPLYGAPSVVDQPLYGMPSPMPQPIYGIPSPVRPWHLTVEGSWGLAASARVDRDPPLADAANPQTMDTAALVSLMLGIERGWGRWLSLGGELGLHSLGTAEDARDASGNALGRTLAINPNLRVSLIWPLHCVCGGRFFLSTTVAGGPAVWLPNDSGFEGDPADSTRVGLGFRASVGGGYAIGDTTDLFLSVGYVTTSTFGDDVTLTQSAFPIGLGLRIALGD
jgi:hypothetical protein